MKRVKLIKICQTPGAKKARRIKPTLITVYQVLILVLSAFVAFPNALVFIASGTGMDYCTVFGHAA